MPAPRTGYFAVATDGIEMTSVPSGSRAGFQFAASKKSVETAPVHVIAAPGAIGSLKPQYELPPRSVEEIAVSERPPAALPLPTLKYSVSTAAPSVTLIGHCPLVPMRLRMT